MPKQVMTKEKKGESSRLAADVCSQPTELKIAYIGGGSRGWAHALMVDLLKCPHLGGEIRLYDLDRELAEFNATYGNWLQGHPDGVSKWKYRAVGTLKQCLRDADFVFLSIQPGPLPMMRVDLEEPMKVGIFQPVGDTVGPGGCIRALRAARDYKVFAEAIAEHAPTAWCINFTNPMTVCTRTLYEGFPQIKAFGCCHEVFGTQTVLGRLYSKTTGAPQPGREQVKVNVLGINHFTWIDQATCKGVDLMELVRAHIRRRGVLRKFRKEQVVDGENWFTSQHQVAFELLKRFDVLGAAGDRHLAEFVPWFLTDRDSCFRWGFRLTPYAYRSGRHRSAPKMRRKIYESGKYPDVGGSGEEYINQMLAILGKLTFRTNVNLPNRGQMGKIPADAVVETNALFSEDRVEPVVSGSLPDNVTRLVLTHVCNQESLVKSVFTRDRDLAFQAFAADPLTSRLGMDDAWKLFNTMLRKTGFEF